jgi:hypothetical protein
MSLTSTLVNIELNLIRSDVHHAVHVCRKILFDLRIKIFIFDRFFLLLACIDRYAISSANAQIRKFGNIAVARRMIPILLFNCYSFDYFS